jgi:hypothetical protein
MFLKNPSRQYDWNLRWSFSCYGIQRVSSNHPFHRIAARWRFRVNPKGLGWGGKR